MERESTLELRKGTKDSYHPGSLHKPIQWLKSSHCVSLLIMRMVFSPLDAFIRSFSFCMHSWYLLFSWHSKAGHMQFKGFCLFPQQTATHKFSLERLPVSYCSISKKNEESVKWSSLKHYMLFHKVTQSHSISSTLAFSSKATAVKHAYPKPSFYHGNNIMSYKYMFPSDLYNVQWLPQF